MPSRYPPAPMAPSYGGNYQQDDTILQLIMRQGQIQAEGAQRSGDIWGNAFSNIGKTLAGGIEQHAEEKKKKLQTQAFEAAIASGDPRRIMTVLGPQHGPPVITALRTTTADGLKGYKDRMEIFRDGARGILASPAESRPEGYAFLRNSYISNGVAKPEELPDTYEEAVSQGLLDTAANYGQEPAKAEGDYTLAPGQQRRRGGQVIAENPAAQKEEKKHMVTVPGPNGRPMQRLATEEELATGVTAYREPRAPREESRTWVIRDGQPTRVAEAEIRPTDKPYAAPQNQRLTKEERQDFAAFNYALPKLDAFTMYVEANPDKYGKWDAFRQGLKQAMPGLADEEYASQEAFITRVNAEIRHALYGASLTGGEQQSAEGFIVSADDQPARIVAKVREAQQRARANVEYYRSLGFNLPAVPPSGHAQPGAPPAPGAEQLPLVSSPAEAARLPKGTRFRTPDGQVRVVP